MGNLNLQQLSPLQATPEVTVNNATNQLDLALTDVFTADLTSANVTLTGTQYQAAIFIKINNAGGTYATVTLPGSIKRGAVMVEVDSAITVNVSLVMGSTTLTLKPGRLYVARTDGTANGVIARDVGGVTEPMDFHIFLPGVMNNAQLCYQMNVTRPFTLPIGLAGSYATAANAAAASTTVTLKKNGSSIGTLIWAISGTTASITFSSAVSFAVGDTFTVSGPATADVNLANLSIDLYGAR